MNQSIFETRQRAEELMTEAIAFWKQSNQNEQLEGLENDPVFRLLMAAVAYQTNQLENDIERLKADVLDDFASLLTPYEMGHATPATVAVSLQTENNVADVLLNSDSMFTLKDTGLVFTPVLRTRLINAKTAAVQRIDGRRWNVKLNFGMPVNDLSLMTFAISNTTYRSLKISADGVNIPLIYPWEYSEYPMADIFSMNEMNHGESQTYDASQACMDLFARHDLRLYVVKPHNAKAYMPQEVESIELTFEFDDPTANFTFNASQLQLNTVILANAHMAETQLSPSHTMERISDGTHHLQLMHTLRHDTDSVDTSSTVNVRRVLTDRYNLGTLTRQLGSLISKLRSDFYAFQQLNSKQTTNIQYHLQDVLIRLNKMAQENTANNINGTYLILHSAPGHANTIRARYVMTSGAAANIHLEGEATLNPPPMISKEIQRIAAFVPGTDEIATEGGSAELVRYAVATNNRIVTPADIRLFCVNELFRRYGIVKEMIAGISIQHRIQAEEKRSHNACGYEIGVTITMHNSNFIRRSFAHNIPQTETILEKMMEVRSANIYPIAVNIILEGK